MKLINLLILLCFLLFETQLVYTKRVTLLSTKPNDVDNYWNSFKLTYNRNHKNKTHESLKRSVFEKNIKIINELNEKFNNGSVTYTSGINQFSDMTSDEFLAYVSRGLNITSSPIIINVDDDYKKILKTLPVAVDWRQKGYVNPVQNQGQCGSCWAFSAVGSLEGQYFREYKKLIKLSEQNLVDCVYKYDGCGGGLEDDAFNYIIDNKGIATSASYKYISGQTETWSGKCKYSSAIRGAEIAGFTYVTNGHSDEAAVTKALALVGPVSAALYVTKNFQFYQSGIFNNDPLCAGLPAHYANHAINLVGYDSENGQDYYILRNSWGTSWGEDGYMRIARNKNLCNIASFVLYPNVQSSNPTDGPTSTTKTTTKPSTTIKSSTTTKPITTTSPKTTTTLNPRIIDLSSKGITQIDANLFKNYQVSVVETLNLNNNEIKVIKANTFSKFKNLEQLSLSNNQLSKLESGWANGLTNLRALFLDSNQLATLPNGTFKGLDNLIALGLGDNDFSFSDKYNSPFADLKQLSILGLSRNNFKSTIGSNSFKNLNQLSQLYLMSSNIKNFSTNAFKTPFCSPMLSRTIIYIANNPITKTNTTLLRNNKCYSFNLSS